MEFREHLVKMVAYEEHANSLWLNYLESVANRPNGGQLQAEADKWLWHIWGCYRSWYDWMTETETTQVDDIRANLGAQYPRMKAFIESCDLEQVRQRSHPDYGTWSWITRDVIHHTLLHGSYHRGHIRAIAEAHGFDDFPDSDWEEFTGWQ